MAVDKARLKQTIERITYRVLRWSDEHLAAGVRSVLGLLFMVGGVLGFLPILGFWMFPLGVALIALDIPWTRHHIHAWMVRLEQQLVAKEIAEHEAPIEKPDDPN